MSPNKLHIIFLSHSYRNILSKCVNSRNIISIETCIFSYKNIKYTILFK